jgi:putative oxidoreductase
MIKNKYHQWAPLFMRLIIGYGVMAHGWAKLSRGPAGFEKLLVLIGVPFPHINSWVVPFAELIGGLAIFVGAFASIAAIPLLFIMLVAMFTIHLNYGFSSIKTIGLTTNGPIFGPPGYEVNLLYISGLISIILTGAGAFSIDSLTAHRKKTGDNR